MNKLVKLLDYGQSYWLDNLTRGKIKGGELEKRVKEQGLRGITSNPAIFNKAISNSNDYDDQIKQLVNDKKSVQEIYEELTVKDVQDACDVLKPVYDDSDGVDGFVSLEVSPYLAHDTEGTIAEAERLFEKVDRPNCFIKIPGTEAGVPAIEESLYKGININVTLLFSIDAYKAVAEAYVKAMERRLDEGKDISKIRSVASFFLSRIDVLVDQLLGHQIIPEKSSGSEVRPEHLLGEAAIANAKLAYQDYKKIFSGKRWEKLEAKGAKVQRPLWASTSTKDPLYHDVRYVNPLIGPNTVNTLPDETIDSFADHGVLKENTVEEDIDKSKKILDDLSGVGIDLDFVTDQLVNEGIQKFIDPFDKLMKKLAQERLKYLEDRAGTQKISFGENEKDVKTAFDSLDEKQFARRLFNKDPYIWKQDDEVAKSIKNRLGWLDIKDFIGRVDEINDFVNKVKNEKFKHVVLLGMGGSSLCPEVAKQTFGSTDGYPELIMLDNTDPAAVKEVEDAVDYKSTLFIVASKSGTTTETMSFYHYYFNKVKETEADKAGNHFVAITDSGTPLEEEAGKNNFRKVFTNPEDYGGRYSALSYFGLVPMALIGVNIKEILENAHQMEISCGAFIPAEQNPAVSLGTLMGINQKAGRDKVTFVLSESISAFGYWVEQLIAESTGKEGTGLVPVIGEELKTPDDYKNDRVFIHLFVEGDDKKDNDEKLIKLSEAGHPVVNIEIKDKLALGAEFFRWELATATAGRIINVNPFDEPNVSESKKNTKDLLENWKKNKSFDEGEPAVKDDDLSIFVKDNADWMFEGNKESIKNFFNKFINLAGDSDYITLLPYFLQKDSFEEELTQIRKNIRDKKNQATTMLQGPRYLHSTGQLHKGGPNKGVYFIFTADAENEIEIPGEEFGFATLQRAQALGDFRSLNDKNRRVIRVHLGKDIANGLKKIVDAIK